MKRSTTLAAAAAATALVLAACGDNGDSDSDVDEEDPTVEETTEDDTDDDDTDEDGDDTAGGIESIDELVIALTPSTDVDALAAEEERLAEALSEALDGFPVRVEVANDYSGAVTAMAIGDVHGILGAGPVQMVQAERVADAIPVAQAERYGSDIYVTQWFTNDPDTFCMDEPVDVDGYLFCNGTDDAEPGPVGVEALDNIQAGDTISYVSEGSASGYYFPATQLNEIHGFVPGSGDLDEQFAGSHDNSVLNVLNGNATVGVSFDDARGNIEDEHPEVGQEVVVFAWAGPIPNDGVVLAGDDALTEDERQLILDAFLSLNDTDEGLEILYDTYEMDGLVASSSEDLDLARNVYDAFPED